MTEAGRVACPGHLSRTGPLRVLARLHARVGDRLAGQRRRYRERRRRLGAHPCRGPPCCRATPGSSTADRCHANRIHAGLAARVRGAGFASIADAVGTAARNTRSRPTRRRLSCGRLLVYAHDHRTGDGMSEQVEPQIGGSGAPRQAQRLHVECVHGDEVPVRAVPGGRAAPTKRRPDASLARVTAPAGSEPGSPSPTPVASEVTDAGMSATAQSPEARRGGRIGVVHGDRETARLLREARPAQLRRRIPPPAPMMPLTCGLANGRRR